MERVIGGFMAFDTQAAVNGMGPGATVGGLAFGPPGAIAGGLITGVASGFLSNKGAKETPTQARQRELIDDLLTSLKGDGPFSDLFNMDEDAFQKSIVDPAKSRFTNQIAPQIQENFVSTGQHRGTALNDTLTRAGVDLDQLINEQYSNQQNLAKNRAVAGMGGILKAGAGATPQLSTGEAIGQGVGGVVSSNQFSEQLTKLINSTKNQFGGESIQDIIRPPRKGFERDPQYYDYRTGIQQ